MTFLAAGITLFVGAHSVRLAAPQWRAQFIARHGDKTWKAIYSVLSLAGLALIVYGFGLSRSDPVFIWNPPLWTRHAALPLTLISFILFAASGGPPNHLKQKLGHPMYTGVKVWAFAHLLANGRLGDMLLFGTLLVWAVFAFWLHRVLIGVAPI